MKKGMLDRRGMLHIEKNGRMLPVRCTVLEQEAPFSNVCIASCSLFKQPRQLNSGTKFFDGDIASSQNAVEVRTCCTKFQFQEFIDMRDKT